MQANKTVQLTKKYKDVTAVDGLDLTARQGELFALLGVNGAGKTTTIKMLTCLTKPDSGNAFVNGNSIVTDVAAVKSIIGVSPQETAVAPNLSVRMVSHKSLRARTSSPNVGSSRKSICGSLIRAIAMLNLRCQPPDN